MSKRASKTRRKEDVQPIHLTERDQAVLEHLLRFVVLTGDHLFQLVGGGKDGFRKRLRKLYDAGFVDRPPIQADMYRFSDKRPVVYTLGQGGADFLRLELGREVPKRDYGRRSKERSGFRGQFYLDHDLGANGCVIALQKALEALDGVDVHIPNDILEQSPEWTQKAKKPFEIPSKFTWPTTGKRYQRLVKPDGIIGYTDHRLDTPMKVLLFVEFDKKMGIKRSDPTQASIRQKIACYSAMFKDKTVKERFGFDAFRVLFVTTGDRGHAQQMVGECRDNRPSNVPSYPFYFATQEAFAKADNPLGKIWLDGDGKTQRITSLGS